jgi:hypothetical protein
LVIAVGMKSSGVESLSDDFARLTFRTMLVINPACQKSAGGPNGSSAK